MNKQNANKIVIIILALAVVVLATILGIEHSSAGPAEPQAPASMGPGGMAPGGMTVKTFDLSPSDPVPTISFTVSEDPAAMGGWDIHITTTNFTWTPENVNKAPVADQGHVHLYVDGKLSVVYGPWYHIDDLAPGTHTLIVALAANDHSIFSENGSYVEAQQTITQP